MFDLRHSSLLQNKLNFFIRWILGPASNLGVRPEVSSLREWIHKPIRVWAALLLAHSLLASCCHTSMAANIASDAQVIGEFTIMESIPDEHHQINAKSFSSQSPSKRSQQQVIPLDRKKTVKNRKIMQDDLQGSLELVFGHNVADCCVCVCLLAKISSFHLLKWP